MYDIFLILKEKKRRFGNKWFFLSASMEVTSPISVFSEKILYEMCIIDFIKPLAHGQT